METEGFSMHTAELQRQPDTYRFDTEHRRYYDTVTWLAEVLPGSMRTPFDYRFDGKELYAGDNGALLPIFQDAIKDARSLPDYEQRRRYIELQEYEDMIAMARGDLPNTMVTVSDFPPELMEATEDVGGYNVTRKQTMLRVIAKKPNGILSMYSQSLDGSDRTALESLYTSLGFESQSGELLGQRMHLDMGELEQEFLVDQLMGIYDRSLAQQHGGEWRAGMRDNRHQNTYDFARDQDDLLKAYLATTYEFTGGDADYNLAAAVRARFLHQQKHGVEVGVDSASYTEPAIVAHVLALQEMSGAGVVARRQGVVVSGCGSTIGGGENEKTREEQLEESGFGNKSDDESDDMGALKFKCKYGHWNKRPRNKLITRCRVASCKKGSVGC